MTFGGDIVDGAQVPRGEEVLKHLLRSRDRVTNWGCKHKMFASGAQNLAVFMTRKSNLATKSKSYNNNIIPVSIGPEELRNHIQRVS